VFNASSGVALSSRIHSLAILYCPIFIILLTT
jgi:hypothetical protein